MIDIHGGNIVKLAKELGLKSIPKIKYDFSVNLNPLGPPSALLQLIQNQKIDWQSYPDIACTEAVKPLAEAHKINPESLTVGNGATDLFAVILTAFDIKNAAYLSPCYSGYKEVCEKTRTKFRSITNLNDINSDAVFIGYPNNPTGQLIDKKTLATVIREKSAKLFIIDESFMDFVIDSESRTFIFDTFPGNLIVVKSLTKMFNIAGIRLGMAVSTKENISKINLFRLPWSVNAFAQKAASVLYSNKDYVMNTKTEVKKLRENMTAKLSTIKNITLIPSEANFLLIKTNDTDLQKKLLLRGIFVRTCENIEGLEKGYYRFAIKNKEANTFLLNAIESIAEK